MISRLAGAVAGLWLCSAGAVWAGGGGGGEDLGTIQAIIGPPDGSSGLCHTFGMNPCPQLPTVTQAILQAAGLGNNLPEMVGAQNDIPPGDRISAGNPAAVPPAANTPMPFPLDSKTSPPLFVAADPINNPLPGLLTALTPLAFVSQSSGTGQATHLFDRNADTFLYAVGVSSSASVKNGLTDPDMVYFFYDDLFRTNQNFATGTTVAKFSFPLTILNSNGTETDPFMVTLQFRANQKGDCSTSTVTGVGTQPVMASQIGIDCAVVFSASPTSTQTHAIFEVAVPLLVTGRCFFGCPPGPNTDPAYFYFARTSQPGPINNGVFTAFLKDHTNGGLNIGLAPTAGPLGSPPASGSSTFALCANVPANNLSGSGAELRPAVGAYYAMAASGEMLLSAPLRLTGASSSVCPPL